MEELSLSFSIHLSTGAGDKCRHMVTSRSHCLIAKAGRAERKASLLLIRRPICDRTAGTGVGVVKTGQHRSTETWNPRKQISSSLPRAQSSYRGWMCSGSELKKRLWMQAPEGGCPRAAPWFAPQPGTHICPHAAFSGTKPEPPAQVQWHWFLSSKWRSTSLFQLGIGYTLLCLLIKNQAAVCLNTVSAVVLLYEKLSLV